MVLEIRLLGPIEVRRDGARVDLRGHRQKSLVAYLALRPGQMALIDALVDALWDGGTLPVDPRQALHTYVSRVRSALGDHALVTRDGGYELVVEANDVDVERFQDGLREASAPECASGRRLALLDEALAMWRGNALDGFGETLWAAPEVARLEELRAHAEDERAHALIDLGRAAEAVASLEAASSRSPWRERTHLLTMTALSQSGRQAEALRVFQHYRTRLGTDLGLEPGEAIARLERAIAVGDPSGIGPEVRPPLARGYRFHEQIGAGAVAVVYRGTQTSVDRPVAIKVVRRQTANQPEFIRRFEAEAHLVARLEHPHIVPLYDYWREPGAAFLVMRLLSGGTLERAIGERTVSLVDVARMVSQVGAALTAAHEAGVVHRDVRPANVFLDEAGNFFLGDFGIASDNGASVSVGPQTDVHGLAVTVHQAIVGVVPGPHEPLPLLRSDDVGLSGPMVDVIERGLQQDLDVRHETVSEFVVEFLAAASNASPSPSPGGAGFADSGDLRNPFKGLRAFDEADAPDFFGRESLVDRLVDHLNGPGAASRVLALVGASGSGKSSVVRAGLLPALRRGLIGGSERWFITSMVPGSQPFEELGSAITRIAVAPQEGLAGLIEADRDGLTRALDTVLRDHGETVLVIDQFEELFTLCTDDAIRRRFIACLVAAVTNERSRVRVIVTLRADFYDRPLQYPELAALFEHASVVVGPLAAEELERAIVAPADRVGVRFEQGLVARILADVAEQPGALPLLQFALTELFDRRASGVLTVDEYNDFGGLTGALARRAEQQYQQLTDARREATRRIFVRLAALGEGTEDTRRRVRTSELGRSDEVTTVLDRYGSARLLTFDHDRVTREQTVEVAHEALLREWPRLRRWLEEDRDGLRLHRHLTTSAAAWLASGREAGELYRGGRLEAAAQWVHSHPSDLNDDERAFVGASLDQAASETETARRTERRLKRAFAAVAAVAVVALVAGVLALYQQRRAIESREVGDLARVEAAAQRDAAEIAAADARTQAAAAQTAAGEAETQRDVAQRAGIVSDNARIAAIAPTLIDTDLSLALLLATEAVQRNSDATSMGALQRVLAGAGDRLSMLPANEGVLALSTSADLDRLTGISATSIYSWDLSGSDPPSERPLPGGIAEPASGVEHMAVSFNGDRIAWVAEDSRVRVLDLDDDAAVIDLGVGSNVVFDPSGELLAIAREHGAVELVGVQDSARRWLWPGDGYDTVDDLSIALGLPQRDPLVGVRTLWTSLEFSSDGTTLYQGREALVRSIAVSSGAELATWVSRGGPATTAYAEPFATHLARWPDSSGRILAGGPAGAVVLDGPTLEPLAVFLIQPVNVTDPVRSYVPLADGRIVVLRASGEIRLVDASNGASQGEAVDAGVGQATSLALSSDRSSLFVGGSRGVAQISLDGSGLIHSAVPRNPEHLWAAAGRDGRWIALEATPFPFGEDRPAGQYFECTESSGCRPSTIADLGWNSFIETDTSRPDLATVYRLDPSIANSSVELIDPLTGPVGPPIELASCCQLAQSVSPDLSWMLNATFQPTAIRVNGIGTGELLAEIPTAEPMGFAVPVSGDRVLAYGLTSGISHFIDTESWTMSPSGLGQGEVLLASYSPSGRLLLTVDAGGGLTVRDPSSLAPVRRMSADGGLSNSTGFQVIGFSDDDRYAVTAFDGSLRLWDLQSGAMIGDPIESLPGSSPAVVSGGAPSGVVFASGRAEVWTFDVDRWPDIACRAAGRNFTREEWEQFGPEGEAYRVTCPRWRGDGDTSA